ncbi:MAG TPA: ABC transporter ATP-binding protein [Myxococcaceae bacterium]|nr:ABC transporter ATP-binding protein [Myxococcaceae bacterium]
MSPGLAIEVEQLVKRFGDLVAVDGVDLAVPAGTCLGLLGPNGAGKTTTVEILEGLQRATSGTVRVLGRSWDDDPDALRARIGGTLQETRFHEKLTVEETLTLFRSFYPHGLTVETALAQVGLEEKRSARVGTLSGGQKQRLALAVGLVGDPELLFLDEPTTGLDPVSRRGLWTIIEGLKGRGRTVVLTTHYMEEAAVLCDEIVIVDHGKVVARGTPEALVRSLGGDQLLEFVARPEIPPRALESVPGFSGRRQRGETVSLSVQALHEAVPALLRIADEHGSELVQLSTRAATLDDVFLALTGRTLTEAEEK